MSYVHAPLNLRHMLFLEDILYISVKLQPILANLSALAIVSPESAPHKQMII